jgi:hypothetical protein
MMKTAFSQSPYFIALTNPINLAMLALAIASGLCAAWWWAPVGLLLWLIMFLIVANDPSLRMVQHLENREPLAYRFQGQFQKVERVQISIFNAISNSDSRLKQVFKPIQDSLDNLVDQAHDLCQRMTVLENHRLISESPNQLRIELEEINDKLNAVTDPLETREYQESRQALQSRLDGIERVERQLNRTDAQLTSLTNELNRIVTEIVRVQSLGPDLAKSHISRLIDSINQQMNELNDFEDEVSKL